MDNPASKEMSSVHIIGEVDGSVPGVGAHARRQWSGEAIVEVEKGRCPAFGVSSEGGGKFNLNLFCILRVRGTMRSTANSTWCLRSMDGISRLVWRCCRTRMEVHHLGQPPIHPVPHATKSSSALRAESQQRADLSSNWPARALEGPLCPTRYKTITTLLWCSNSHGRLTHPHAS